jgi:hypothetical protein
MEATSPGATNPSSIVGGVYVTLLDSQSGQNVIAAVTGISGAVGTGTVIWAAPSAPEARDDTVQFNLVDVLQVSTSPAVLLGALGF